MSLRVNTNIASMNALRTLGLNTDAFARSIERLSSGMRINRGADDPAGLIISENLRAQMVGLSQAVSNAQDAANLVKTAEGALDEIHNLLRTMRQLAVHASNVGVNDQTALQADQNQIASALQSLNRIAQTTQFGTKKLLDGSAGITAEVVDSTRVAGIFIGQTFQEGIVQSGTITAVLNQVATRAQMSGAGAITYSGATATIGGAGGTVVINGQSIQVSGSDTIQTLVDRINAMTALTGVTAALFTGNASTAVVLQQVNYGSSHRIEVYQSRDLIFSGTSSSVAGQNARVTVTVSTSAGVTSAVFEGGGNADTGIVVSDSRGNRLVLKEAGNSTSLNGVAGIIKNNDLVFQIGANSGQVARLSISDLRAFKLGTTAVAGLNLEAINVTTLQGAQDAIKVIDEAISQVSVLRGNMGAFQKQVLESTMRSLNVARENLAASESAIRDTNVAEEVMNYTKLQILQQAGMAVLAQANMVPQMVLSLLR